MSSLPPTSSNHSSPRRVLVTCRDCGKQWEKPRPQLYAWQGRCNPCGRLYVASLRRGPEKEPRPCKTCGQLFQPARKSKRQYCSRKCAGIPYQQRTEKECLRCGSPFSVCRWDEHRQYCSGACYRAVREERRQIGRTCRHCGEMKPPEAFRPARAGIATVCRACEYPSTARERVTCKKCGLSYEKVRPSLRHWSGFCRSCSLLVVAARPEVRLKAKARCGPLASSWKGGITAEHERQRRNADYAEWRKAIFERDDFACVFCGTRGGRLNADHILSFARYPQYRLVLWNGRTLCSDCHKWRHLFYKGGFSAAK
jgi:5-methylcytosine-specific restriction endonuclease McrA